MKLHRILLAIIAAAAGCVALVGCDPGQIDLSDLQTDVTASGGGNQVEQTRIPISVEVTVSEKTGPPAKGCHCTGEDCPCCDACGCRHDTVITLPRDEFDFRRTEPQRRVEPQKPADTRPVVFWVSDFGPGECGACEAVKASYRTAGSSCPFRLEQRPRSESPVRVQYSPTFYWRDSDGDWRYWSTGSLSELISTWRNSR